MKFLFARIPCARRTSESYDLKTTDQRYELFLSAIEVEIEPI